MRILLGFLLGVVIAGGAVFGINRFFPEASGPLAGVGGVSGATTIMLNVTERQSVKQDVMTASLRFEQRGATAEEVQAKINENVAKALEIVKAEPSVKVSTESYSVYMNRNVVQKVDSDTGVTTNEETEEWIGSQALVIESTDGAKVQALSGQLQALGFAMNNFGYSLSPAAAEKVRETLMSGAVAKLQAQADSAAKLLGKKGYVIREIGVDGGVPPVMPMYKAMRMEMAASDAAGSMPAPKAEPGETEVTMTLNARVELKD